MHESMPVTETTPIGWRADSLPSICFVAPHAYPALSGRQDLTHIGGAERQQVMLAEALVHRGHRVSFVVLDHGVGQSDTLRGIQTFTCYRRDRGLPGVRFFHPRLRGLWSAMQRADADVYYQRGAEAETGLAAHWCRRHGRAFVFAVAHDTNCTPRSPLMPRAYERWLFRHGIRRADAVVAQTEQQRRLLRNGFGVTSTVVRSAFVWPWDRDTAEDAGAREAASILWVGRLSEEKRPDWLIRLAREAPSQTFDVVGSGNSDSSFSTRIVRELQMLPNARWHGHVPHHRMLEMYRRARLVACTSASEGFPNVFLEAWACGKGVLSTVDPDTVIERFHTGRVATRYEDFRAEILASANRREPWEAAGRRGQLYVTRHHTIDVAATAMTEVLADAVQAARGHDADR